MTTDVMECPGAGRCGIEEYCEHADDHERFENCGNVCKDARCLTTSASFTGPCLVKDDPLA